MAIGLVDGELFGEIIETTRVTLEPGATVLVYTDGITEAMNVSAEEWGKEPLARALVDSRDASPDGMCQTIRERVMGFVGDTPQSDDMTLLMLKVQD